MKKTTTFISGLLIVIFLVSCKQEANKPAEIKPRPVKAVRIEDVKSFSGRSFPGRAKATQEINLSFNVSGSLIELPIKIGDKIKKGDLIAKLDQREFEAKLKSAKAEANRDQQNFLRAKELVGKGHISKSDYDLVESKRAMSQANLDLAEKAMIDSVIKAPFDGQISNLYVENYQTITSKEPIARLLDASQIEMVVQIPENAISLIPNVKDLMVEFDAFPNHLIPAQIKEISNEATPDTGTFPVTLTMNQPNDITILPGMSGKVRGSVEQRGKFKISVPSAALWTTGNDKKTYVWIIHPNTKKVHPRLIEIGELTPQGVSVLKGIKPGDWVVTAGIHTLQENETVTILNQAEE